MRSANALWSYAICHVSRMRDSARHDTDFTDRHENAEGFDRMYSTNTIN